MTLEPLLSASLAVQIHVAAAVAAFFLGGLVLFRRKGDRLHRMGGRIWVGLMLVTALSSFFIHSIKLWGIWSPIHLLSIGTLAGLVYGVGMARLRRIAAHRFTMQSTYVGGLIVAGAFAFMPGRIMHEVFFEGPAPAVGILTAAAVVAGGLVLAWLGWRGGGSSGADGLSGSRV